MGKKKRYDLIEELMLMDRAPIQYLLLDRFVTDRAAGSVNGTPAEPGRGGKRLVRDVESKIAIAGGTENWTAQATPAYADQDRVYNQAPITRAFGVVAICKYRITTNAIAFPLAFVNSITPTWAGFVNVEAGFYNNTGALSVVYDAIGGPVVVTLATDTDYLLAIELRTNGAFWKIKSGAFPNWTTLFAHTLGSTATLYIASDGYTAVFSLDDVRSPLRKFYDTPLASDSFARADGALGITDGLGHPEANGGGGLAWQFDAGAWAVSSNAAVGTPTQGAELLTDGGLENWTSATDLTSWVEVLAGTSTINREATTIHGGTFAARVDIDASNSFATLQQTPTVAEGTWVRVSFWLRASASGKTGRLTYVSIGIICDPGTTYTQYSEIFRTVTANPIVQLGRASATSASLYWDDISVTVLTLSSLFSSLTLSTINVQQECVIKTLVAGTQAGCVWRLNNAVNPTSGGIAYWDGAGNVKVDEFTTATAWTNLLNVVKAYATGDKLVPWLNGSAWRLYHVTAAGVATLLGSGTTNVTTGNLFGNFSTYSGNAIESCNAYATGGAENPYSELDQF